MADPSGTADAPTPAPTERVCVLGSGAFGTTVAGLIAANVRRFDRFDPEVAMWTFEETLPDGALLSRVINDTHVNVKYLPGHALPPTVVAVPEVATALDGATLLVFVLPHQFLPRLLPQVRCALGGRAGVRAISLIKGVGFDGSGLVLLSHTIRDALDGRVPVAVLSGANVATEIADRQFCEATIGCADEGDAQVWRDVFDGAWGIGGSLANPRHMVRSAAFTCDPPLPIPTHEGLSPWWYHALVEPKSRRGGCGGRRRWRCRRCR
jgi:glycerol-3-phosphate dehydrogenase (NAD+)